MSLHKNAEDIANHLYCLSVLEIETSSLYRNLAEKVELPLVKSMLLQISLDSQKHSTILNGIVQSTFILKKKPKDCAKNLKQTWETMSTLSEEISAKTNVTFDDFPSLTRELETLESALGEEYSVFLQLQTLDLMSKKIFEIYKVDIEKLHNTFENIIRDEETHRGILADIRNMFPDEQEEKADNTPLVQYQNPDAWRGP